MYVNSLKNLITSENNVRTIKGRIVRGHHVILRLDDGSRISLRRYPPIGEGDRIVNLNGELWAELSDSKELIPITPTWVCNTRLQFGSQHLNIEIKEIENEEELAGYQSLTEYHYRGGSGIGRSIPLVASVDTWQLPKIVGFIELSSSFLVNLARKRVFDTPFSDPERNVAWVRWDTETAKRYASLFVRISRCVVFPELRGVGLSTKLVEAAIQYAKERWHLGGRRPSFIEITADMLRYWPFVKKCGFQYAGETEGNEHRALKDMKYLLRRFAGTYKTKGLPQGGGGIMHLQRSYALLLSQMMSNRRLSLDEVLVYLRRTPEKLNDDEWILLHKIFRRPKPTYLKGLTKAAQIFLDRRKGLIPSLKNSDKLNIDTQREVVPVIDLDIINIKVIARPRPSERGRKVQEAFGIISNEFNFSLVKNIKIKASKGEIILISGPSGSGKSLLLRAIRWLVASGKNRGRMPSDVIVEGTSILNKIKVATLRPILKELSPIELLNKHSLEESLKILASAGLAEPQLYVRPAGHLSVGQTYRLSLALALADNSDVVLIDEFCESLDEYTTFAVCKRLKRAIIENGLSILVATASPSKVLSALVPDHLLVLSSNSSSRWFTSNEISGKI
jgi:ABC-type lipoprotein export system ATPase subunit/GNAT superfamily N-acetyltransferase